MVVVPGAPSAPPTKTFFAVIVNVYSSSSVRAESGLNLYIFFGTHSFVPDTSLISQPGFDAQVPKAIVKHVSPV